jgi:pilus assembly protein Flp/PilA
MNLRRRQRGRDEGASAVEYALIVGAIAAVVIFVIVALGVVVHKSYSSSCTTIAKGMQSDTTQCSK